MKKWSTDDQKIQQTMRKYSRYGFSCASHCIILFYTVKPVLKGHFWDKEKVALQDKPVLKDHEKIQKMKRKYSRYGFSCCASYCVIVLYTVQLVSRGHL